MNSTQRFNAEEQTGDKWICQVMAAEGVIGVLGNILVCFVILRVKFLHNMTNYLLVNLAVADMLLCFQSFFFYSTSSPCCTLIAYLPESFAVRILFCRLIVSEYLAWALFYASAYNVCVVTFERFAAIVHPLQFARQLTATRMKTMIALIWVMSFLFSLPFLFINKASNDPDKACTRIKYPDQAFPIVLTVTLFLFGYLLPITLMSLAYYKMQVTLKRQANALKLQHARAAAYDLVIARQRLVTMLMIVLGALIILWTPGYTALLLCLHPTDNSSLPFCHSKTFEYIHGIFDFAFYFNSVINPFIYEFKYKKFRKGLKVVFCSCFKRHGNNRVDIGIVPL
ncbi:neuromedin-U receptor 2-like [Patiria miniata]|uniref:G-protein coupled receptors family 1 profile domain-containing protein n=1 Tax=Patiria miniata TaxID=46514 RepID=A0A914B1S7_PATMI|nr:neuromedin-U receptor 2-like [Patiria miniata]